MRVFSVSLRAGRRPGRRVFRSRAAMGMALLVACGLLLTGCAGSAADAASTQNQTGLKSFGDLPSIGGTAGGKGASGGAGSAESKYPIIYLEGSDSRQTDISQPLGGVPGGMTRITLGGVSMAVPDDYEIEEWPEEGSMIATEPGYPAVINLVELQCYEFTDQTLALQWMEMEYERARRMFTYDSSCAFYVETEMPCNGYTVHYLSGYGPALDNRGKDVYYVDSTVYMIYNGRQIFYVVLRSDGSDPYMDKVEATVRFDPDVYYEIPQPAPSSGSYGQPVGSGSGIPVIID